MMMLKSGDSNLNRFSLAFGESAMGSLKQTILEQDFTFRKQVRELHRLYWTQKNLMNELCQNGVNAQVGNALFRNEGALLRNHQRNFNLQLPADVFISIDQKNYNNHLTETDLSKSRRKFAVEKSLLSSFGSGYNEIIDLEDSVDLDSQEKAKVSLKENHLCCVSSMVHFGEAQDRRLKEQMPHVSCVGIDDSSLGYVNNSYRNTHESEPVLFDLNTPVKDSDVHSSSQDFMLADNNTKNFENNESILDINVLSSAYPVEGTTGSSDGALISINETLIPSIELTKQEKGGDSTENLSNHEESEEDTLSSHTSAEDEAQQNALLGKSYGGYNSNGMRESSSYEKDIREPATLSITDDSVITQSHSTENEMSYFGKFKSEEQDIATTAAAQALMAISFGRSEITSKKFDVIEVAEVPFNDETDQLQDSSDSFETMTMHLSEIQNDEIMPDIPRLNVEEKEERMIRSKRGKGLRNFQKDILPGLVSLTRHEICEDLYSINYKFRRHTSSNARNFFAPVTRRRSRICSGRRQRRSFPW
ncbi:hypothetical protein IEQ34_014858 [Dendrobium chrysotoxum]|uniref:Uncharacterized protein n=1 Tax=Dendrobium chrysotoxum TaxID=161865 RepID=A0AAV7GLC4_DENCH|nr:hypothetical protein IEQ34_014858 [Dendrobium chrysotoxum]